MKNSASTPMQIKGGKAVDDRGVLTFINDLNLDGFKRFYVVENHEQGFIRAWHGHLRETKAITVVKGSILVGAVKMTDATNPDKSVIPTRYVVSADTPSIVLIPSGYANGFKTLTQDAIVLIFSSSSLDESQGDDFRFDFDYWNVWDIEQR